MMDLDLRFLRSAAARKRVVAVTACFAALGVLYALFAPKWYRSTLTVVAAKQQKGGGGLSTLLGGELGGLAAGIDPSLGGGADPARIAAVLQSIAVTDAVIEKFDLRARYREKYQEAARETLWRHCDAMVLPKPGLVQLTCEDRDRHFAQQMLAYFAEYGNQVFRRVSGSSAGEEARFLEKRVAELRQQADEAAERMRNFQEKHRIVDLETQAKAVVSALAALNAQRIGKQLELDFARTFSSRDEPSLRQLESQLSIVGEAVRDLEQTSDRAAARVDAGQRGARAKDTSVFPPAAAVPQLRAEFEKLYRDRKVSEASLVFALERLESAKANEARDVSTFLVLDPPALPTRHARPKRLVTVATALLVGLLAALALEWWRAARSGVMSVAEVTSRGERGEPGSAA